MERTLTGRKLALIAGTRVVLGIGIGLLLSRRMTRTRRKVAGIALVSLGALSTIPLGIAIVRSGPAGRFRSVA